MNLSFQKLYENFFNAVKDNAYSFIRQMPGFLIAILIIAIGIFIAGKLSQLSRKYISGKTDDVIMTNFLSKSIRIIFSILVIMYALNIAGLEGIATGILTAAGASAIVIGFAFRDIGENFISGIILSFNRPFNVNDSVSIGEIFGKVKTIEFRYTKLKTFDGRDVYIPNSDVIKKPVFNYTEDGFFRFDFTVGIAYEDNIENAEKLIMQTLQKTENVYEDEVHENFIIANELSVSTVNLKVHFWIQSFEYGKEALLIKGRVISKVKEALLNDGFSMPANISEVKLYGSQKSIPVRIES